MHDTMNFNDIKSNLHIVAESCEKVDVAGPGCNVQQGQAILKQKAEKMKTDIYVYCILSTPVPTTSMYNKGVQFSTKAGFILW